VFPESTSQVAVFRETALPLVHTVLQGTSALLFTYGVTNSGKTFTVQGTPKDSGILPRALDVLFNSIGDKLSPDTLVPLGFNQLERLAGPKYTQLLQLKQTCLNQSAKEDERAILAFLSESSFADDSSLAAAAAAEVHADSIDLSSRVADATRLPIDAEATYAVFVSYAEVYNEGVFDLFARAPPRGKRRAALRLAADGDDNSVYIRDLREFPVASVEEALRLLNIGRRNRRVAATQSNTESSRSHCIFTVKLARVPAAGGAAITLSRLTIVDLAGSERYTKSLTTGQQLKEAGNINQSLMVLGRCIETLRWNQTRPAASKCVHHFLIVCIVNAL
jgi:kinesin family protein 20